MLGVLLIGSGVYVSMCGCVSGMVPGFETCVGIYKLVSRSALLELIKLLPWLQTHA